MQKKLFLLIFMLISIVGCVDNQSSRDSIVFVSEKSIATLVETDGEKLLSVYFVVKNTSHDTTSPFFIDIKVTNQDLESLLEEDDVGDFGLFTLKPNEKHGFGGTMIVKTAIPAEQLRSTIEDKNSLKVELMDKSGRVIATEWIKKLETSISSQ